MSFRQYQDIWWEEIKGMFINKMKLTLEVGKHPDVSFHVCMNVLIEKQSDENLEKLKGLIEKEIRLRELSKPKGKGFLIKE